MTKTTFWIVLGTGVSLVVCCFCLGGSFVVEVPAHLLLGWAIYPFRVVGETSPDWPAVGVTVVSLTSFTLGLHAFCRWFYATRNSQQPWAWRWTFGLVGIVLLAFLAGIAAIGITHQATWLATNKEPLVRSGFAIHSDRSHSSNNMRQIGTAVHNYHGVHTHLPLGGTYDAQGRGMHGWQTILLPYMEQQPLYNSIDLKQPWNAPANARAMSVEVMAYQHPSIDLRHADGFGLSHYAGNVHVLGPALMKFGDIADGTSQTILAGEVSSNFKPWGHPATWRDPALGLHKSPDGFGGPTPNVTQFLMADASVRKMRNDANPAVLKAFATPNGGEKDAWD